jgi:hypothetical protein
MAFSDAVSKARSDWKALTPEERAAKTAKVTLDAGAPDARLPGFADWLKGSRQTDMAEGADWAKDKFGAGNPEMKAVMDLRKLRAQGLNTAEVGVMRDRGVGGINQQLATGLRQLKGMQGASGLMGGATLGQAMPHLAKATQARAGLETDIALADMQRRGEELNRYESTLTGERTGALGAQFGFAGLGAGDRSSALQHLLGRDFIQGLAGAGGPTTPLAQKAHEAGGAYGSVFNNPTKGVTPQSWFEGMQPGILRDGALSKESLSYELPW